MARERNVVAVAIVGAGLSGLVAARRLMAAGVGDVRVLEARERVGGRVARVGGEAGVPLEAGAEFVADEQRGIASLAAELELGLEALPGEAGLASVRLHAGARHLEETSLASDAAARAAFADGCARLDALGAEVPFADPWTAERADELDVTTAEAWLERHVEDRAARAAFEHQLAFSCAGHPRETSLLYLLWKLRTHGGSASFTSFSGRRVAGGTSALVARLAEQLGDRIVLGAPVDAVAWEHDGATIYSARGPLRARAAILALSPALAARLRFEPVLPADRERLQQRWTQGRGVKTFFVYDTPFWRARGLSGGGSGHPAIQALADLSPLDGSAGVLCGLTSVTGEVARAAAGRLADRASRRALLAEAVEAYLGPDMPLPAPRAYAEGSWLGDPWSGGCSSGLGPGTLASLGHALRAPVGPLAWAGAETGVAWNDYLEGAVDAGERAAAEALACLDAGAGAIA